MTRYPLLVTAVRAAFIGNVSAAQMNRLVDEALIPEELFAQAYTTPILALVDGHDRTNKLSSSTE